MAVNPHPLLKSKKWLKRAGALNMPFMSKFKDLILNPIPARAKNGMKKEARDPLPPIPRQSPAKKS